MNKNKIRVEDDTTIGESVFLLELSGGDWNVWLTFPVAALSRGASLRGYFNTYAMNMLKVKGWHPDKSDIKDAVNKALPSLREFVEDYFERQLLVREVEDDDGTD